MCERLQARGVRERKEGESIKIQKSSVEGKKAVHIRGTHANKTMYMYCYIITSSS